jgi:putative transposase
MICVNSDHLIPYADYHFPHEMISYAVRSHFPFPLRMCLRMMKQILAARSIDVTYEPVHHEPLKLGQKFDKNVRHKQTAFGDE